MFLVGLGSGNQLCLQPVANLFDDNMQGTVILSLSGAFQISGLLFLMLTAITKDRRKSFGALSFCLFLCTIASAQILPTHQFKRKEEEVVDCDSKDMPNLKKELELTTASNAAKHEDDIEILWNTNIHGKKAASLTYGPDVEMQKTGARTSIWSQTWSQVTRKRSQACYAASSTYFWYRGFLSLSFHANTT